MDEEILVKEPLAHDFVYSWQRLFDPKTAAQVAEPHPYFLNSAEILAGKRPPWDHGVRAPDDHTGSEAHFHSGEPWLLSPRGPEMPL